MTRPSQSCGVCGGLVVSTDHDDGARSWRCPCGRTQGCILDGGTLDLGSIRAEPPNEGELVVLWETFEQVDPTVDP